MKSSKPKGERRRASAKDTATEVAEWFLTVQIEWCASKIIMSAYTISISNQVRRVCALELKIFLSPRLK